MAALYEVCPVCNGTLYMPCTPTPHIEPCPCTRGSTPGYAANGVTTGQVERWAEQERVLAGDPGIPLERRRQIVSRLASRVLLARELQRIEGGK